MNKQHTAIGAGGIVVAALMAYGASSIPGEAGYAGIGANFLPWAISLVIGICGLMLMIEGLRGGFSNFDTPDDNEHGNWKGFAWVSAGLLLNAGLITTIGFILSCSLLYMLAVQGFKGTPGLPKPMPLIKDALVGAIISAPVFWLFGMVLSITLPSLTGSPWL